MYYFYLKKPHKLLFKILWGKENLLGDSPKNVIGELYCDTEFVEYLFFLFLIFYNFLSNMLVVL